MAPSLQRIEKPRSHKGRKILLQREPQIIEGQKKTLFFKANKTSEKSMRALKDLLKLKKPKAEYFEERKDIHPFEDPSTIERMCKKFQASLFSIAHDSKKRPSALICGRLYENRILDIFEFLVEEIEPLSKFFQTVPEGVGNKPLLVFSGEEFDRSRALGRLKNFLIDYFRGEVADKLSLNGLKYVISFFLVGDTLHLMSYTIKLLKSGQATPRVELVTSGPQLKMKLGRTQLATEDLYQQTLKVPKSLLKKKTKNISHDPFNAKLGRVHMKKQDFSKLQLRKVNIYKHVAEPNPGLPEEVKSRLKRTTGWNEGYEEDNYDL